MEWLNIIKEVVEVIVPLLIGIFGNKHYKKIKGRRRK